jgi:PAS domain S-box-containing protein
MTAWIGLLDHETNALKLVAHWGIVDKYLEEIVIPVSGFARDGRGPAGTAFLEGKSVIRNNIDGNLGTLSWHKRAVELGYRSTASFPLRSGDRIVGSLNLYADKPYFFNDDEVQLLETLANDISFAIDSIELERGREKAEELLRESEGRLRSIVENARDAIVTVDGEGNIVYWNKGAKTLYGYSAEEIIGKPIATILPERLREDHKKMIKKVLEGEILNNSLHRVTAVTKDGAEINLEGNYFIWKEEDRTFIAAIFYNPLQ